MVMGHISNSILRLVDIDKNDRFIGGLDVKSERK